VLKCFRAHQPTADRSALEGAFFENYIESAGIVATPELDDALPEDRDLGSRFLHDFEVDLTSAQRLQSDTWRKRPVSDKALEWFWSPFGEVF
jgi:hypothetical protein